MNAISNQNGLREGLERLETALETPLVPGELERWVGDVQSALDETAALLERQVGTVHQEEFNEIADEDPELFARVKLLQEEDRKSSEQLEKLRHRAEQLAIIAASIEPDEAELEEDVNAFIEQGLAFVIHVRKQEIAIATWLQEAMERDRGTAD